MLCRYWFLPGGKDRWVPSNCPDQPCKVDDAKVDVFYLSPTTVVGFFTPWRSNAYIDEVGLGNQDCSYMNYGVFNNVGRVFVPKFRQYTIAGCLMARDKDAMAYTIPYNDIKAAFKVFLSKYCTGNRPFIIAGHSQGAELALQLLIEVIERDERLVKRMVACYAAGSTIERDTLTNIKLSEAPNQTNCLIVWNTVLAPARQWYVPIRYWMGKSKDEDCSGVSTNLLSWSSSDPSKQSKDKHIGGFPTSWPRSFFDDNVPLIPRICGARLDTNPAPNGGGLQVDMADNPHLLPLFIGNKEEGREFHGVDFHMWWMNIRENVKLRVESWYKKYN